MDKETIHNAFPQILRNDVLTVISVLPFEYKVVLNDGKVHEMSSLVHPNAQEVLLNGEKLVIPTRIYFNEPNLHEENTLTELQKVILNCIYRGIIAVMFGKGDRNLLSLKAITPLFHMSSIFLANI